MGEHPITDWVKATYTGEQLGEYTMSAVLHRTGEQQMRRFMEWVRPKIVVETGTHHGIAAALMAQYAERVYTFDPFDSDIKWAIWDHFGVADKISYIKIKDDLDKASWLLEFQPWDFAFVDGMHNQGGYAVDFHLLSRCGRVLFHDAVPNAAEGNFRKQIYDFARECPWPTKILDNPFAYVAKAGVAPAPETWNATAR